ncbi:MAG: SRPBCC domain-containing protein [Flavobacteriales bacterium]|jgi:hypothetical protein|nr:SRPBCC domain-containing protein [Flavobacteriales bacterium]
MAFEIKTEIIINATPQKVWSVFSNFKEYPNWNPFIQRLTGDVAVGQRIEVLLQAPGSNPMTFRPKVLAFQKNKKMTWLGYLFFRGLFDGEHHFELIDNKDGATTFIQSEKFKGLLVPLLKKQLDSQTRKGFLQMNQQLKELVEIM